MEHDEAEWQDAYRRTAEADARAEADAEEAMEREKIRARRRKQRHRRARARRKLEAAKRRKRKAKRKAKGKRLGRKKLRENPNRPPPPPPPSRKEQRAAARAKWNKDFDRMVASLDAEEKQKAKKKHERQRAYQRTAYPKRKAVRVPAPAEQSEVHAETKNVGSEDAAETVLQHLPHGDAFVCEDVTSNMPLIWPFSVCFSVIFIAATLWRTVQAVCATVIMINSLAGRTVAGGDNLPPQPPPPLPPPSPAPDSSLEPPGASVATAAATTDTAEPTLQLEIRVGRTWHVLALHEPSRATVATLRDVMYERLHLRLTSCRLVPVVGAGADVRTSDDNAPLLDVLGTSRQFELLAPLCGGGGGKDEVAAEGKGKAAKTKKDYTTISGLGLSAHLGPAVPLGRNARDPLVAAAMSLKEALELTISENVAGVAMTNIIAVSALYAWVESMVATNLDSFDAAALGAAFGTELSAKSFGAGLFCAALGKSSESGNEKLPAALKEKLHELRNLFLSQSEEAAQQLCTNLRDADGSLAKALKKALEKQACVGATSGKVSVAAGQSFGTAIRNHWKADAKRAVRRMLFEEVKAALAKAELEFNDKVTDFFLFASLLI